MTERASAVESGTVAGALDDPSSVADRFVALRSRVDSVARAAGRDPASITLVGVSKRQLRDAMLEAIAAGLTDVGESYVQEAREKLPGLPPVRAHFIGHIQTNKAKTIVELFDVVQSIDRPDAGRAIARAARASGKAVRALIQVNVSPTERYGIAPEDAAAFAAHLREEGLAVDGVMAIAPNTDDAGEIGRGFERAASALAAVGGGTLSIGMSGDWEAAVAHGSTMLRIGTAIFGPRPAATPDRSSQ